MKVTRSILRVIDALKQEWQGVCWLNPPYGSQLRYWIKKAYESANKGATIVCLLPARTCTTWWHDYVLPYAEIRYLRGRLKFSGAANSATFPSAIVIFRPALTDSFFSVLPSFDDWASKMVSRANIRQNSTA